MLSAMYAQDCVHMLVHISNLTRSQLESLPCSGSLLNLALDIYLVLDIKITARQHSDGASSHAACSIAFACNALPDSSKSSA